MLRIRGTSRGRYANAYTHARRTAMTVANTASADVTISAAEVPFSPSTAAGSCSPIIRNANDSSTSCTAFHTARSCSRAA